SRSNESSDQTSPRSNESSDQYESSDHTSPQIKRVLRSNDACLSSALQVGCSAFACLENLCQESIKCIAKGITSKVHQTIRRCAQKLGKSVDVARSNLMLLEKWLKYYSTLLQSLMECDEDTVGVVRRRGSSIIFCHCLNTHCYSAYKFNLYIYIYIQVFIFLFDTYFLSL
uniref:Stanniocalcin n=1 Tax=Astyanax mexicanus TaxID=7994 RepID=A0A3B1JMA5_ASTMX